MAPVHSDALNLCNARTLARGVAGGADDDPKIPELPSKADLEAMDEDALRALHGEFEKAFVAIRGDGSKRLTQAEAETLGKIREAQGTLAGAVTEIHDTIATAQAADKVDVSIPDSPATLEDTPAAPDPTAPAPEPTETAPPPDPTAPDAPTPDPEAPPAEDAPVTPTQALQPVGATAAVDTLNPGDFGTPAGQQAPPVPARARTRVPLRAAAGPSNVAVGTDLSDMALLGRAITEAMSATKPGPDGQAVRAFVATIGGYEDADYGVELLSPSNGAPRNTTLIHETVAAYMARLASNHDGRYGGTPAPAVAAICDPLDVIREIPDCTTDAEPFSDTLPGRPAGRLGFQFMPSAVLGDVTGGVTIWDEADQAAVSATNQATWKPCVLVTCPSVSEVMAEAVTACLLFDNTTEMSSPERVADFMRKIAAAKARAKEDRLLTIASTFTHRYRHVGEYGAVPSSILALLTVLNQGWATNRLEDGTLYNWYVPQELLAAWVIDLVGQAFLQDPSVISDVVGYIEGAARAAGKNVRIVPLLDRSITPTLPIIGGVAEEYLESGIKSGPYETYLIPPEGAIYFTTGEINVGVERSPELMRQNRAQWFMEEYVGLAKHGCQPWYRLELDVCENGTRAALTTPWTCEGAS